MAIPISVERAAEVMQVHPNTVRRHIAQDRLPTVPLRRGGKGRGNGALVDLARLAAWTAARNDFPQLDLKGRNPIRETVELALDHALAVFGAALESQHKRLGISIETAAKVYMLGAVLMTERIKAGTFEKSLAEQFALGDLDDMASILTANDVRTAWAETKTYLPEWVRTALEPAWRATAHGKET